MADSKQHASTGSPLTQFSAKHMLRTGGGQVNISTSFNINTAGVTGTQIPFSFISMPGNQPQAYGDTVFIWQTSTLQIPINTKPLNTWSVVGNNPDGDNVFPNLKVTEQSYLLGFGVGPNPQNICATAFLPGVGQSPPNPTTFQPSVTMTYSGSGSVSFNYVMPQGARPLSDGDWVGLWQGLDESAIYSVPPNYFIQAPQDLSIGGGAFNGVTILRQTVYTLAYFRGGYNATTPKQTTAACSSTWQTAG